MSKHEMIAILDFGGQYKQLTARRIRECGVYCEILPHSVTAERLRATGPKGIILTGGPSSVYGKMRLLMTKNCSLSACRCLGSATARSLWHTLSAAK